MFINIFIKCENYTLLSHTYKPYNPKFIMGKISNDNIKISKTLSKDMVEFLKLSGKKRNNNKYRIIKSLEKKSLRINKYDDLFGYSYNCEYENNILMKVDLILVIKNKFNIYNNKRKLRYSKNTSRNLLIGIYQNE